MRSWGRHCFSTLARQELSWLKPELLTVEPQNESKRATRVKLIIIIGAEREGKVRAIKTLIAWKYQYPNIASSWPKVDYFLIRPKGATVLRRSTYQVGKGNNLAANLSSHYGVYEVVPEVSIRFFAEIAKSRKSLFTKYLIVVYLTTSYSSLYSLTMLEI